MATEGAIDVHFDFRSDTPPGEDPDRFSPTLVRYHRELWSKPLPGGVEFELRDDTPDCYLHHRSSLGEFFLSSDAAVPTYRSWAGPADLLAVVAAVPEVDLDEFQRAAYTLGAMIVFPGNQVDRKWTINQARGMLRHSIGDRLDLTLECIRRHYAGETSPLAEVLDRYRDYFALFGDFRGYADFFLFQDLTTGGGKGVSFFLPCEGFERSALPRDLAEYDEYRLSSVAFVSARNGRIAASIA